MKKILVAAVFAAALQMGAKPVEAPVWTALPPDVARAMCVKLKREGFLGEVRVVMTTEPFITRESLLGLAEAADVHPRKDPQELAAALAEAAPKLPVLIEPAEGCNMRPAASAHEVASDEMMLQFSPPIVNPFKRGDVGLFARLSLRGEAPQWYWVPLTLKGKDGKWFAGMPYSIAVPH
jgi:hypothetical protein